MVDQRLDASAREIADAQPDVLRGYEPEFDRGRRIEGVRAVRLQDEGLFDECPCESGCRSANAKDFAGKALIIRRLAGWASAVKTASYASIRAFDSRLTPLFATGRDI